MIKLDPPYGLLAPEDVSYTAGKGRLEVWDSDGAGLKV